MAERYSRLFSLPENLYAEGAPVMIAAGALLKDNQTGKVLAQLKMSSLSSKAIKSLTVCVVSFDGAGRPAGDTVTHNYLDLNAVRSRPFGQKEAFVLPDNTARAFSVSVVEVIFADGSIWAADNSSWEPMEARTALPDVLSDAELVKQYRIETGSRDNLAPAEYKDLWLCSCGAVNRREENACHSCTKEKAKIFAALNSDVLREAARRRFFYQKQKRKRTLAVILCCIALFIIIIKIIIPGSHYKHAVALMNAENYPAAIEAFEELSGYRDSYEKIVECNYLSAVQLMDSSNYEEAFAAFKALNGYKDSALRINSIYCQYVAGLSTASVGDTIVFGKYEQNNNTSDGKEKIEWLVLEKKDGKILVISQLALDCQPYNATDDNVTWEDCTLRNWLNSEFLNTAFTSIEQTAIIESTVPSSSNPTYSTDSGNPTIDKIFLFSIDETEKYFASDEYAICFPSEYAITHSTYRNNDDVCFWWLRTPGSTQRYATYIRRDGSLKDDGRSVTSSNVCVRPALWISLSTQ